jgi:hypothetical protein
MKNETFATCLGMIVSLVVLVAWGVVMNGWALSLVWNWFIPPLFGLTTLTMAQAMGVSTVFTLFVGSKSNSDSKSKKDRSVGELVLEGFIVATLGPLFVVAFAWVILQFSF